MGAVRIATALLKTSSKSCLQVSQFALIKLLFAHFKQPEQIFLLKMELPLDLFFAFLKSNSILMENIFSRLSFLQSFKIK